MTDLITLYAPALSGLIVAGTLFLLHIRLNRLEGLLQSTRTIMFAIHEYLHEDFLKMAAERRAHVEPKPEKTRKSNKTKAK